MSNYEHELPEELETNYNHSDYPLQLDIIRAINQLRACMAEDRQKMDEMEEKVNHPLIQVVSNIKDQSEPQYIKPCPNCKGKGSVPVGASSYGSTQLINGNCPQCRGKGIVPLVPVSQVPNQTQEASEDENIEYSLLSKGCVNSKWRGKDFAEGEQECCQCGFYCKYKIRHKSGYEYIVTYDEWMKLIKKDQPQPSESIVNVLQEGSEKIDKIIKDVDDKYPLDQQPQGWEAEFEILSQEAAQEGCIGFPRLGKDLIRKWVSQAQPFSEEELDKIVLVMGFAKKYLHTGEDDLTDACLLKAESMLKAMDKGGKV